MFLELLFLLLLPTIKIFLSIVATAMACVAMTQYAGVPIVVENSTM